jgi:hypothetical protein
MKTNNVNVPRGGVGFTGWLTIAFIVLKLTHVIDWSWWWVFSPIIASAGFILTVFLVWLITVILNESL